MLRICYNNHEQLFMDWLLINFTLEAPMLTCVEICAGAGGQALGLDMAGFTHIALVEYEKEYCEILKTNRPNWNVICEDSEG